MNKEKMIMDETPDQKPSSKTNLFVFLGIGIVVIAILLIFLLTKKTEQPPQSTETTTEQVAQVVQEPATEVVKDTITQPEPQKEVVPQVQPSITSEPKPTTIKNSHLVEKGESLWKIADRTYGNPYKWAEIYDANKDIIKNPDLIYPEQEFVIPKK